MTEAIEKTAPSAMDELGRRAKALSSSDIIPEAYRGRPGNCLIAMEMADRMGCTAMQIMQSMHIIHGRPSLTSQWLIATVNASGRFTPLRWRLMGPEGSPTGAAAYATDKASGEELTGPAVTLAMAKAEGWSTKSGSKWATMPELMLRYRAAAFWARLYCPDVAMGLHTSDEVDDVRPARHQPRRPDYAAIAAAEAPALALPQVSETEEIVDDLEA